MKTIRTAIGLALLSTCSAWAQSPPDNSDPQRVETVVTVTTRPVPVEATAADVGVIDGESARAAGKESVADVLRSEPALYVGQSGQRGGLTSMSIRGGDPNFTLFMIDGIPVNDITDQLGGTVDVGTILPFNVSRVEVLRGPISAIYGSEATAGAVNIITDEESPDRWNARIAAGNFGTAEGRIANAARLGRFSYNAGVAGLRIGEQIERDSFHAIDTAGRAAISLGLSSPLAFTLRVRRSDARGFPANSGGPLYALNRDLESREAASAAGAMQLGHATARWSHLLQLDYFRQTQDQDTPAILDEIPPSFGSVPPIRSRTRFGRARLRGSSSLQFAPGWIGTIGVEYRNENGRNNGIIQGFGNADYRLTRSTAAVFGETLVERQQWSLIAGFRSDWISGYYRLTPRAAFSHTLPWKGARARVSWGQGFKMPSFYALAHPFVGNPQLKPETSQSVDAGMEQSLGNGFGVISLNVFHSTYSDLVDFSPSLFRLVNRNKAVARGFDVLWRLVARGVTFRSHVTYVPSHIEDSPEPLRDRPRWRAGANASIPVKQRTAVYADILWVGTRYDFQVPVPELNRAPSYTVVNVAARHVFNQTVSGFVRADNVFDRRYQEYNGFPNPGVQARAGIDLSLR